MKLHDIVEAYIDYKHSLGMRFRSPAAVLRAFNRAMGDIDIAEVKPESVLAFIAGTGPITARWRENHRVLRGFYRYAVGRGCVASLRRGHQYYPGLARARLLGHHARLRGGRHGNESESTRAL